MIGRLLFRRPRESDPGEAWALSTLEPLSRQMADCDVAPAVMARIAALRPRREAAAVSPRALWLAAALPAAGLLGAAIVVAALVSDQRFAGEAWALAALCGRLLFAAGGLAATFVSRVLLVAGALLKPAWVLIEVAAPLLRSAGLAAAGFGALSVLFSLSAFARALRAAPAGTLKGGTR